MKILVACLDQEVLWTIDDEIGGLYSIDLKTFKTKCAVDCQELFRFGKYKILSLFRWNENYIVMIPLEIDKDWILYNKITGEIEFQKVVQRKCQEILITVDSERKQLYFFPLYLHDPILIVDLNTLKCVRMIENWSNKISAKGQVTAWKGAYNGRYIFFPVKNTKILVRMDCETRKVDLLELDISEKVIHMDYAFGELWVLPINGNKLYQLDENGLTISISELSVKDSLPNFARIIVQERYLFLLPCYQKGIYVYDKLERKTYIIMKENADLDKRDNEIYLRYWEYYVKNNRICFLPFGDKCIEIDLDTLAYKKKKLSYPDIWSDKERIEKIIWSQVSEEDSLIREINKCNLKIILKYLQFKINTNDFSKHGHAGQKVWNMLKN